MYKFLQIRVLQLYTSRLRLAALHLIMDTDEFLRQYETDLRAMTRADKGLINSLTMLAADHVTNGDIRMGIVRTIEKVVTTVSSNFRSAHIPLIMKIIARSLN